jgi:2-keto-3-deoxy-L-rhamnonate aldolase RhmA
MTGSKKEIAVPNRAKRLMESGQVAISMMIRLARTADIAPMADAIGYDAINIDMEHSSISLETACQICVAALTSGITPLIRVPSADASLIGQLLDGGAQGVIVPHVENAAAARAVVSAARFPPVGHRSIGGASPHLGFLRHPAPLASAALDGETLVAVMLETGQAIDAADSIAAVQGIDMIMIGTNDLCADLGVPGQLGHPKIRDAYASVAKACRAYGKHLAIGGIKDDVELLSDLLALGARFISGAADSAFVLEGGRANVEALQRIITSRANGDGQHGK